MISEWMKVMLEEISRKKAEAEQARLEDQQRAEEHRSQGETGGPRTVADRAQGRYSRAAHCQRDRRYAHENGRRGRHQRGGGRGRPPSAECAQRRRAWPLR